MPSVTKTLDPAKWLTNFGGIPLTAYAKGTFIEIEYDEDAFSYETGASGHTVRVKNNNSTAKITLTLMADSSDNDRLSAVHAVDRATGEGITVFSGKELNGSATVFGEAWINKLPKLERGDSAVNAVWVFTMPKALINLGGLV